MEYNSNYNLNSLKRVVAVISLGSFLYISFYGSYLLNKVAQPDQIYLFIGVSFVLTVLASISIYLYDKRIKDIFGENPAMIIEALRSIDSLTELSDNEKYNYDDGIYSAVDRIRIKIESRFACNDIENKSTEMLNDSLEKLQAQVMVTDSDLNIIYVNTSAKNMFHGVEKEIRKSIPSFSSSDLIGSNIDQFHTNPHHQRSLLPNLKSTHTAQCKIGDATVGFIAHPLFDSSGVNVGTVVEWENKTQQIGIEEEICDIVNSSLDGDLTKRISIENKEGFYRNISYSINDLLSVNQLVIEETSRVLKGLSEGSLNDEISYDYAGTYNELKIHANATISKLHHVLTNVKQSSQQVHSGAQEISQGNINLSNRTEDQAMSLEKTAAAMEEMTGTVRQNADNANDANRLASSTREQAENSGSIVKNAILAMAEIKTSSTKIADIIGVIDEIAFQTNLLALNAAVEAAHAGDQGRGFAVVASEVRNLAQRSAEAAKEIKDLIKDSVDKVDTGTDLVNQSGNALEEIVGSVKRVSDIIAEIATANQEQSTGIEQVNQSVLQMDESTQQNAAMVEQVAAASETLGEQSNELNQMMSFFSLSSNEKLSSYDGQEQRSSNRPWSEGEPSSSKPTLNIAAAKSKHLSWKTRIRSFLDGKESLTMNQAVSHRDCDLGKWIYSEGITHLGGSETFDKLEKCHAGLHADIKEIIALKDKGKNNQAEEHYRSIETASGKVVRYLSTIEKELISGNYKDISEDNTLMSSNSTHSF